MFKANITTTQGRAELVKHTTHDSHLEGHDITTVMTKLMEQFVAGKMTIDEVIQARMGETIKVA